MYKDLSDEISELYNNMVKYKYIDVSASPNKISGMGFCTGLYNIKFPYVIAPRRPGDVDVCYSDPSKAREKLGWTAEKSLEDMCRDSWHWQTCNNERNK